MGRPRKTKLEKLLARTKIPKLGEFRRATALVSLLAAKFKEIQAQFEDEEQEYLNHLFGDLMCGEPAPELPDSIAYRRTCVKCGSPFIAEKKQRKPKTCPACRQAHREAKEARKDVYFSRVNRDKALRFDGRWDGPTVEGVPKAE